MSCTKDLLILSLIAIWGKDFEPSILLIECQFAVIYHRIILTHEVTERANSRQISV